MYLRTNRGTERRRGGTLVLTALCMTGILFLSALAIDMGNLMAARRQAQECCDAAALTSCIKLATLKEQSTGATHQNLVDAANLSLSHNSYTTGTNCTVVVNSPPLTGGFQNDTSVEVLLTFTYNNLVVHGTESVTVRSVASCNTATSPSFPMLVTDPSGANAFWVNSGKLTLGTTTGTGTSFQVDSNNAKAAVVDGMSNSAANAAIDVSGGASGAFTPAAQTGGAPLNDPFSLVPVPSKDGLTTYSQSSYTPNGSGNVVLNPGYYPNGLYVTNGGNVTMNPGLYYVEGGNFWINTTGTVTGNGVTIYHNGTNSSAQLQANYGINAGIVLCPTDNNYTFTPPTTGPYTGMSFFQSPSYSGEAFYDFWGKGTINTGIQYFPDSTLRCWTATNGGTINCNELVTKDFKLAGTHEIYGTSQNGGFSKLTWNASRAANRPATNVYLAE